jgi:hypothetical protein
VNTKSFVFNSNISTLLATIAFALALSLNAVDAQAQDLPVPQPGPTSPSVQTAQKSVPIAAATLKTSISGRLLGDGGEPLSGVDLMAFPSTATPGNFRNLQTIVSTDEQGNFKIEGLSPGLYTINPFVRGHVPDPADIPPGRTSTLYRAGDTVTIRLVKGGVITGAVTDANGEPLVAMSVRAYQVRDLDGVPVASPFGGQDYTDDRGVYRMFGLRQGVYVVAAGLDANFRFFGGQRMGSLYDNDAPTFYQSGTRDTAVEITVRNGQETAGIDIRFRGERGRRVTGTLSSTKGQPVPESGATIALYHSSSGTQAGFAFIPPSNRERSADFTDRAFSFEGVADGDYEVQAQSSDREGNINSSTPVRIVVNGADVTGLKLALAPLGSVSGNVVIEPLTEAQRSLEACKEFKSTLFPQETIVSARRDESKASAVSVLRQAILRREWSPDQSGAFTVRNLEAGRHRIDVKAVDDNWYTRAVQFPAATAPVRTPARTATTRKGSALATAPPERDFFELTPGQRLTGVTVRVAEGAARLHGRLVPGEEGAGLPSLVRARVHLLPAEREHAESLVRHYETTPASDGAFVFKGVAPGKYLLFAREVESQLIDAFERPLAWDRAQRERLRKAAEAANVSVELQQCGRMTEFSLRYPAPTLK